MNFIKIIMFLASSSIAMSMEGVLNNILEMSDYEVEITSCFGYKIKILSPSPIFSNISKDGIIFVENNDTLVVFYNDICKGIYRHSIWEFGTSNVSNKRKPDETLLIFGKDPFLEEDKIYERIDELLCKYLNISPKKRFCARRALMIGMDGGTAFYEDNGENFIAKSEIGNIVIVCGNNSSVISDDGIVYELKPYTRIEGPIDI